MAKNDRKPAKPGKKMTPAQQAFVRHLAADPKGNQTRAAIEAGYNAKTATEMASQLMNLPKYRHVQAAYQALVDARLAKLNVTEDKIERTLAAIAFGDQRRIQRLVDGKLVLTDSDELFPEDALMIQGYKEVSLNDGTGETKVIPVFADRTRAAVTLAKIKGMLRERIEAKIDVHIHSAREALKSSLARLATAGGPGLLDQQSDDGGAGAAPV
jgi:hypothetical protein